MNRHQPSFQGTIIDAINDENLFAPWFAKNPQSWQSWLVFLKALFGLSLGRFSELPIYRQCTGRQDAPTQPAQEAWLVVGRRGGKSFILALCAVYLACFHNFRRHLAKGERAVVMVIATDRRQSRIIFRYIGALLRNVPLLSQTITHQSSEGYSLENGLDIEIHTSSFRSIRGYAVCCALCDEIAFWKTETSSEPDYEILAALRPAMSQFGDEALLLCASSPYARRGVLWENYRKHFGKPGPILVWQAPTRVMNPTIPESIVREALERDPSSAQAEYLAQFRTDIEGYITREAVEACIANGIYERPPSSGRRYTAFTDPSGGSSDSFTLAIAHRDDDQLLLDCMREVRPPFSPEAVVAEFAQVCKSYRVAKVSGDRYAGEWPAEQFRKHGIIYQASDKPKSDLYLALLPLINSRKVELLDNKRLLAQLAGLERRTARSGRDSIDHAPGAHDDVCNAVAGALLAAQSAHKQRIRMGVHGYGGGHITWLDPATQRPLDAERGRVKWVTVPEASAPAVKGRY